MSLGAKKLNSGKLTTTAKGVLAKAVLAKGKPAQASKAVAKSQPPKLATKPAAAQKIALTSRAALVNKPNGTNVKAPVKTPAKTIGAPMVKTAPAPQAPIDPRFEPFQELLKAKRAELAASLGDTRYGSQATGRVAEEDQASVSHEEFISSKRNSMEFRMLRLVNAALDRIVRGEYGMCHACEEEISEKRLKVIPWAEFCVHCQDSHGANHDDAPESIAPGAAPALQVWNW